MSKDKILVVEDAPDISSLLKIYFTSQGFEVMTAMRGQVALEMCRKTPPNLALLDVNLPDMEGSEVMARLRSDPRTSAIPVVVISADAMQTQIDRLLGGGACAYLTKPIDVTKFLTILDDVLKNSSVSSVGGQTAPRLAA